MDKTVRWVTKAEAAKELEISPSTLNRKVGKGDIQVAREGTALATHGSPIRARDFRPVIEPALEAIRAVERTCRQSATSPRRQRNWPPPATPRGPLTFKGRSRHEQR